MFEKYWKPHFDNWSEKTNQLLEGWLQREDVLQGIAGSLETLFRSKIAWDRLLYFVRSRSGLSTYRDQKKILHLLLRLQAQVEDLGEKFEDLQRQLEDRPSDTTEGPVEQLDFEVLLKQLQELEHQLPLLHAPPSGQVVDTPSVLTKEKQHAPLAEASNNKRAKNRNKRPS